MKFIDEAVIEVAAGEGGRGAVSFRRESKVPYGGPDGGKGGKGGDVIVHADTGVATLLDHRYRRHYRAEGGASGGGSNMTGRSGVDLEIPLPVGTVILDEGSGEVLADLVEPGQRSVIACGGRGGRGNSSFATATRRAPRFAQDGEPGQRRRLELHLKLVADVGLLGLPNAGKSTFIRAVTRSQARVADYPFTTLVPNLGVARVDGRDVVLADIPGLVEGAHAGHGLGDRFLKHVERTRVLIHLLSLSADAVEPLEAWRTINRELAAHSPELAARPQVVVLSKVDLLGDRYEIELWREAFAEEEVELLLSSGTTGEGTLEVLRAALAHLDVVAPPPEAPEEPWSPV